MPTESPLMMWDSCWELQLLAKALPCKPATTAVQASQQFTACRTHACSPVQACVPTCPWQLHACSQHTALQHVITTATHLLPHLCPAALRRRLCAPVPTATALQYPSLLGFGQHIAISMALGMLFLAAGSHTFGTSNSQVAALVIALFPKLPQSTTDHRCHLQVSPL